MTSKGLLAVCLLGAAATTAASLALSMSAWEALQLAGVSGGAAVGTGVAGAWLLSALRRRPIGVQATAVGLVSLASVGVGAVAAAGAMFLSSHDLYALLVVLPASATVGAIVASILGRRVTESSRALAEMARLIGSGDLGARPEGAAAGEFASLSDELEAMSRRLRESRDRERALEASRRELTAWVSHDLRTPLAGIRAMAEALEDGVAGDPATVARYHKMLRVESERLAELVDDLFELSVIQAGALRLHLERVPIGELVSDAIAAASVAAGERGVRLEGHVDGRPPQVELSPPEVARVLRNLLENAIRHTPNDGAVWVEAGTEGDAVFVSVADECGGIPESDLSRLFDPAFRGEAARTPRQDGGAGLGLAIARGIVEAHHGEISVRNEGRGCRFTVWLPLTQPA